MIADNDEIILKAQLGVGTRVVVFVLGLIPFLAPYQLLYKPHWNSFSLFLILPLIISLGASVLGFFFMYAALKSPSTEYYFDRRRKHLELKSAIPFDKMRSSTFMFSEISSISTAVTEWEQSNSYYLVLDIKDRNKPLKIGPFNDQQQASATLVALKKLMEGV